jgi:site-specific DNA-methyltransferase (adenine-specific)
MTIAIEHPAEGVTLYLGDCLVALDALPEQTFGDSGSAARFFYSAKADAEDRLFSKHPTVKPVDLMRWLVRMVTPPGGTVLDLFAGTGTTGHAALLEGCKAILIEREPEYQADIRRRMSLVFAGDVARKSQAPAKPAEDLPLFAAP